MLIAQYTLLVFTGRKHGPWTRASFWTPVNTAHRDRQTLLLVPS